MKSVSTLIAIGGLTAVLSVAAVAAPAKAKPGAKAQTATVWPQTCPVTGEKIATAKDAYETEVYKGKTYYFCCAGCKPMFDKDPAKYIKPAAKAKG